MSIMDRLLTDFPWGLSTLVKLLTILPLGSSGLVRLAVLRSGSAQLVWEQMQSALALWWEGTWTSL